MDEIKAAFRRHAHRWHPDKHNGHADAEARFKQVVSAYAILSDHNRRRAYDLELAITATSVPPLASLPLPQPLVFQWKKLAILLLPIIILVTAVVEFLGDSEDARTDWQSEVIMNMEYGPMPRSTTLSTEPTTPLSQQLPAQQVAESMDIIVLPTLPTPPINPTTAPLTPQPSVQKIAEKAAISTSLTLQLEFPPPAPHLFAHKSATTLKPFPVDNTTLPHTSPAAPNQVATWFITGMSYYEGTGGVKQDYAAAAQWFLRAARQGHTGAQTLLGVMYAEGSGVAQSKKQALYWYQQAAKTAEH